MKDEKDKYFGRDEYKSSYSSFKENIIRKEKRVLKIFLNIQSTEN